MALKTKAIPSPVPTVTKGGARTNVPAIQDFEFLLNAARQKVAEMEQELASVKLSAVRLIMSAKDEPELAASYIMVYRVMRDLDDVISAGHKPIKEFCEEFKIQKLPEAFEAAKTKSKTLDNGDRVSLSERVFASVKAGMKEAAIKFLKSNKKTKPLVTETINAGTLASYAGTLLEQNLSLPDDIFSVSVVTQASLTRGKK